MTKVKDGVWRFAARVQYNKKDFTVTLNVPVFFAGDPPQNQQALAALTPVVGDADVSASEQATIAIGWIAQAAAIGSDRRRTAIDVLRRAANSDRRAVAEQARKWLANVGAQ